MIACVRGEMWSCQGGCADVPRVVQVLLTVLVGAARQSVDPAPEVIAVIGTAALSAMASHAKFAEHTQSMTAPQRWTQMATLARMACKGVAVPAVLSLAYNSRGGVWDSTVTALV